MTFTEPPPQFAPPKSRTATRKASPRTKKVLPSLRTEIDGLVTFLNEAIRLASPYDALDPAEVAAVVHAMDVETQKAGPLRRGIEALTSITSGSSLPIVLGIIIGRRVARRRMFGPISPMVDSAGGMVIQSMNVPPSEAAEAMDSIMATMRDMMSNDNDSSGTTPANE